MNKRILFALWGGMFVLCAGLGFIPEPTGFLRAVLVALALGFFAPPALLLYQAARTKDRDTAGLVRNLSAAWLITALTLLVANVLSLLGSAALGNLLHCLLVIATAPMICGQYWILSLFCWACLFFAGNHMLRQLKTEADTAKRR